MSDIGISEDVTQDQIDDSNIGAAQGIGSISQQDQDNYSEATANIISRPIAGDPRVVGRSNILRTANYDPTFAAALQISRGLNPGENSPIARPSYLQPQIEGRGGQMYFSPVEKFFQEDVADYVQKGGIAGVFLSNLIKSGVDKGIEIVKDGYNTGKDFLENILGIEDESKTNLAKEIATEPGARVYDERLGFGTLDEDGKFIPDQTQDEAPRQDIVPNLNNLNSGIMRVSDNRGVNFSNLFGTPRAQLNLPLDFSLGASPRNRGTLNFTSPRGIETTIGNIGGGDKQVDVAVPLGGGMALETRGIGEGAGASTTFSMNRPGMGFDVTKLPNDRGFTTGGRLETPYLDVFGRVNPGGGVNVGIGSQIRF